MMKKRGHLTHGRLILGAILSIHVALLAFGATRQSVTFDELGHLAAGMSHWRFARYDLYRVNPPLVRQFATIPLACAACDVDWSEYDQGPTRSEFSVARALVRDNGPHVLEMLRIARWMCIPFSVIGAIGCYCWSRDLYGTKAGLCACTFWCFDPTVLGHGQLITPDVAAAGVGVLGWYAFWRWLRRPSWTRSLLAGAALGAAMLTKSTWILCVVLVPAQWLAYWIMTQSAGRRVRWQTQGAQCALIMLTAAFVVNAGYLWEGSFKRLREYEFVSNSLRGSGREGGTPANRFSGSFVGEVPVPLPENYLRGMDEQRRDFEFKHWNFLRGEWKRGGWWYYYVYGLLVKVPIGAWFMLAGAVAFSVTRRGRQMFPDEFVVMSTGIVVLLLVSTQTGLNAHVRYGLPALPFVYVFASKAMISSCRPLSGVRRLCILWFVSSSMWCYPHSLSYFNECVGGPRFGKHQLLGSNVDWGQDVLYLKRWVVRHPEARRIRVAYVNQQLVPPSVYGLACEPVPDWRDAEMTGMDINGQEPLPGWYAISVGQTRQWQQEYRHFEHLEPVEWVGYSIRVYRIRGR